ncbi:Clavaminate synthase-like protein [Guyanagaster necrorhizus]|uniref:Clavaminate synthase-like protein n=1 Tax=Guyanagaster necrorhizus TaxID=856835 RepID=A0A9P7VLZ1_9AGAR|nr:Clavaminate synthase-like protein [Guyanagaster necrorhizus MCA 3950]KAG7443057.1 Clavaminate synthase-like protein [Guyanagaster necrorhizus MCA 3950]
MSLPIIDILPYLEDDRSTDNEAQRREVAAKIHNACVDYGFFYLNISSYVDPQEPEELIALARQFFSLPQEEKDKISLRNEDQARGYARLKENVTNGKADNHEGIDWYRPVKNPDKTKPLWGENQWPTVPTFREKYERWVNKMKILGVIVMRAMADGLSMTSEEREDLSCQVDDSFWVMRAIGYPPLPNDHDGFSCGAHKDYGCLTFLYTDPTPAALQVFTHKVDVGSDVSGLPAEQGSQPGSWINANPIPGCVICNIGEMWEIWTNGLYKSTLHRVVHRSMNYSDIRIPFFFEPNFNAHVKPLAAALRIQADKPNPDGKEYKPVVYGDFLLNKVGNNFSDGKEKY